MAKVRGFLLQAIIGSKFLSNDEMLTIADFYKRLGPVMTGVFSAMAVAFALGGGLLLREASERIAGSSTVLKMYKRRAKIQDEMTKIPARIERLGGRPKIFKNDFSRGAIETLEGIQRGEEKREKYKDRWLLAGIGVFILCVILFLIFAGRLFAGEMVVVGLDMSVSELAVDHKGETEFSKNVKVVGEAIVPNLGPDSDLRIWGITGNSLRSPYEILKGRTGKDPGYFGELLKRDIQRISEEWGKVSRTLKPTQKMTDLFGYFSLAAMTYESFPTGKKTLLVLSDMRNCTPTLNLELPERLDPKLLDKLKGKIHIPNLEGTDIHIHGVHSFGKAAPDLYYHDLKAFWVEFISLTKGTLKAFSNLREISLGQERRKP